MVDPASVPHELITSARGHAIVHGTHAVGRFNAWLAITVTRSVGSVWCAYLFCLVALVSLPAALTAFVSGDTVTGVAWFSQSFAQLVLLPIILTSQNVSTAADDARAATDHDILTAIHEINIRQLHILELLHPDIAQPRL